MQTVNKQTTEFGTTLKADSRESARKRAMAMDGGVSVNSGGIAGEGGGERRTGDSAVYGVGWGGGSGAPRLATITAGPFSAGEGAAGVGMGLSQHGAGGC